MRMTSRLTRALGAATLALAILAGAAGCHSLEHTVGRGKESGEEFTQRQWYAFFGLMRLGRVDSKELAGAATDYVIYTRHSAVDYVISLFSGLLTVTCQSVTVRR